MEVLTSRPTTLNRILSHEDCEAILDKSTGNPTLVSYNVNKISENVMGFLGDHFLLTVKFSEENGKHFERVFFLKCLPQINQTQKDYVEAMGIFKKEVSVYKNLISEFLKLTTKKFAPQFYFCNDECIVLENMCLRNFSVSECNYLTLRKCKSALKTIASFHSASLIFEEKRSNENKKYRINQHYPSEVVESTFNFTNGHPRNKWLITVTDCLKALSQYFNTNHKIAGENLENYIFKVIPKMLLPSEKFRNVVTHDDLWCNNMMFDDNDDCVLVDFQLTRYTPPVFDVLLTLYINMERNLLQANISNLLEHYYICLEKELENHKLNIQQILPKPEFLESVNYYTLPTLIEAAMYGTNVFLPKELSRKVVSNKETFEEFTFKNRTSFIVHEFEHNLDFRKRFSEVLAPLYANFN